MFPLFSFLLAFAMVIFVFKCVSVLFSKDSTIGRTWRRSFSNITNSPSMSVFTFTVFLPMDTSTSALGKAFWCAHYDLSRFFSGHVALVEHDYNISLFLFL